jgi:hypothetical protein
MNEKQKIHVQYKKTGALPTKTTQQAISTITIK